MRRAPGMRFGFGVLVSLLITACAMPVETKDESRQLVSFLSEQPGSEYSSVCDSLRQEDRLATEAGRYIDPSFRVIKWRGHAPDPRKAVQSQNGLLEVLTSGELRVAVVVARGGMGKSSLARSMAARACDYMPVFKLDANEDILPNLKGLAEGDNAIMKRLRELAVLPDKPESRVEFERLLKTSPWLLLVDSLDELGLKQRPQVLRQLKEILEVYANGLHMIIFARPPVFASAYELAGVDSMMKIQDLTCARVEERINAAAGSLGGAHRFWEFAVDLGISRRALEQGVCAFPQMSTYRDINVALSVALGADLNTQSLKKSSNQRATRSSLYGHYIDLTLKHLAEQSGMSEEAVADLIGVMVEQAKPNPFTRDVVFNSESCERSIKDPGAQDKKKVCDQLFSSRLFKKSSGVGSWRFTNQSVMDYFLAQWMDRSLEADGAAQCGTVTEMWRLFESNEVAGFLVGMKNGVQCLPEVFMQLCINGANFGDTMALMDQGLPPGLKRVNLLRDVRERSEDKLSNSCFRMLTQGLVSGSPTPKVQ